MNTRVRSLTVLLLVALLLFVVAVPAFAGKSGIAGKSRFVGHLYLYTKTPAAPGVAWPVVPGPWGKMTYKICPLKTLPKFVFNGHGLTAGDSYTLLNYTGYANVQGILGKGVANKAGDVHIAGRYMTQLVSETPADPVTPGAKIWLVNNRLLSETGTFTGWDPSMILFEGVGIPLE